MLSWLCIEEPPITVLCALYSIALPTISFIAILSNMFDKPTVFGGIVGNRGGVRLHPPARMERRAGCGRIGAGGIAKTGTFLL